MGKVLFLLYIRSAIYIHKKKGRHDEQSVSYIAKLLKFKWLGFFKVVLENRVCLWEDTGNIFIWCFVKIIPINFVDTCYNEYAANSGQNGNFV